MAAFVAQRFYVEHGPALIPGKVQTALEKYLPRKVLTGSKSREGWVQAIISSFNDQGITLFYNLASDCVIHILLSYFRGFYCQLKGQKRWAIVCNIGHYTVQYVKC